MWILFEAAFKRMMAKVLSQGAAAVPGPGTPGLCGGIGAMFLVVRMNKLPAGDDSLLEARATPRFLAPMPASCILLLARKLGWPRLGHAKPCKTYQTQNESPQDKGTMQGGNS